MKYHGHIIKRVVSDLGFDNDKDNSLWEVYDLQGNYVGVEPCLYGAKELIDYGESSF